MNVSIPQTVFEVAITEEEERAIDKCIDALTDILNEMDKYNCIFLSYGYSENCTYITNGDITDTITTLNDIKHIYAMYE